MSENQPTDPPTGDPATGDPPPEPATGPVDLQAEVAKWKKLSRDNEAKAKANADAAKRLQEIEAAQQTEQERLLKARQDAETAAADAQRELALMRVGLRKGLSEDQLEWLKGKGDSEDDLEAAADRLIALLKPSAEEPPDPGVTRRPRENLRPGAVPAAEPQPSAKDIVDKVMAERW